MEFDTLGSTRLASYKLDSDMMDSDITYSDTLTHMHSNAVQALAGGTMSAYKTHIGSNPGSITGFRITRVTPIDLSLIPRG